ncbi:uncharacterized protein LOC106060010 [Biomphalaria glabrata]|uniref:Uncharacterized protein LOC106060010 n=1 Tax=Biomphalaria glabrata TaxID=6526 RepID=A0A9U8E4Q8_BIOGL|nr:uncharacterized protein LOC106060010 [Biomphalaria glabrata]KAI8778994.1 hypothetical protein BgiBS90_019976 [Biomphalaria glabrata]
MLFPYQIYFFVILAIPIAGEAPNFSCTGLQYFKYSLFSDIYRCNFYLCIRCESNVTLPNVQATLSIKENGTDVKNMWNYKQGIVDVGTHFTFAFLKDYLFHGPTQFQIDINGTDKNNTVIEETIPWTEPEVYFRSTYLNFTINGSNDTVIVNRGDNVTFLCSADGYPLPLVGLNSLQMSPAHLFNEEVIDPGVPITIPVDNFNLYGNYSCYINNNYNNIRKEILLLVKNRISSYEFINQENASIQTVSSELNNSTLSINVYGYPAPASMRVSCNDTSLCNGVSVLYESQSPVWGKIHLRFFNDTLANQNTNISLTVDNGFVTIFEISCTDCNNRPINGGHPLRDSSLNVLLGIFYLFFISSLCF